MALVPMGGKIRDWIARATRGKKKEKKKTRTRTDLNVSLSRMFSETGGGGGAASSGPESSVAFITSMGAASLGGADPARTLVCCEPPWGHHDHDHDDDDGDDDEDENGLDAAHEAIDWRSIKHMRKRTHTTDRTNTNRTIPMAPAFF